MSSRTANRQLKVLERCDAASRKVQFEQTEANERGRLRGINHLRSTLEAWEEMSDDERKDSVAMALDRLENPW